MLKIDKRLRDCITAGEMVEEPLSHEENKMVEAQFWRDLNWLDRPRRTRKRIAPPGALQASAQRDG